MWIPEEHWRYVSAAEMRAADRYCIEDLGLPGAVLMYNAGSAVAEEVAHGPMGIVCGKGNNGGDGFVVAVRALARGQEPRVVVLAGPDTLRGDAKLYHDVFVKMGGKPNYATTESAAASAVQDLADCPVLVDAMLGTGFAGAVRGAILAAITHWPKAWTVAVDVPSGLDADTGEALGPCIRADVTVTFQAPKLGFREPGAKGWLGRVRVADIGIPENAFGR